MSKLNLVLSYKNACILKHALRDKVATKEKEHEECLKVNYSVIEKEIKELEEEKRALAAITEEIDTEMHRHNS